MMLHQRMRRTVKQFLLAERGDSPWITLASAAMLIIVGMAIATTTFTFVRTGTFVLDLFSRTTQLNVYATGFQNQANNLTDITVYDDQSIVFTDQPSKRTAYYSAPASGTSRTTCVQDAWAFVPSTTNVDLLDLAHTTSVYAGDACTGTPATTRTTSVTGFNAGSHFTFANASGRDLHYVQSQELGLTASTATRPAGLFDNEWKYPYPTIIKIEGSMQNLFNTTPVVLDAVTSLKQMRPGSEPWVVTNATAPTIQISQIGGDSWQASFTPTIPIEDNRAVVTWAEQDIVGTGTQTGALTSFTNSNVIARTVTQGNRWQIQALYKISLGGTDTTSATGTADWVRPIDTPSSPSVNAGGTGAVLTLAACPTGTTAAAQLRYNINGGGWTAWYDGTTVSYTLRQGDQVQVQGTQRCYTIYTTSTWALSGSGTYTAPISSQPSISVTGSLAGGTGTAAVTANGCPAWLTTQVQVLSNINQSGWGGATAWFKVTPGVAQSVYAASINEGAAYQAGANGRCISTWAQGPSKWGEDSNRYVRPITTAPWVVAGIDMDGSGNIIAGRLAEGGCPAGTSYQWNRSDAVEGGWNWWFAGWAGTDTNWVNSGRNVGYGQTGQVAVIDRCVTAYTQGPNSAVSYSATKYRAYPAPNTPSGISLCHTGGGANSVTAYGSWNSMNYASSYQSRYSYQRNSGGFTYQWTVGSWQSGSPARHPVGSATKADSINQTRLEVQAKGSGGWSGVGTRTSAGTPAC